MGFHGLGNDNEVRRHWRHVSFRGAKNEIAQAVLKSSERGAMDCVNYDWNAGAPGGQTPENSSLATMSVDNIRFLFAEDFLQRFHRAKIVEWMNRPDEIRDNSQ